MQLSYESYRSRWLFLVTAWCFAATAIWMQAHLVDQYLNLVGQLGLRGAPFGGTPLQQEFPAFAADAQMWIRHALALLEGDDLRLRYTMIDNAPQGREVHWNSAWAWCIAGAGWLHHLFTGLPIQISVERATVWLNPVIMFGLIVFLSTWATRHAGAIAGVVVVIAIACHDRISEGFFPSYVDHHGLLTVAVFGVLLGSLVMGGGWWQPTTARGFAILPRSPEVTRSGAIFSALSGACGLWVSAASTIPSIGIVGAGAILAIIVQGRSAVRQGATFAGDSWRLWGKVGAFASIVFYLIEYFPSHFSFRLEPNHPFHAIAWLGGGELIAQFGERWLAPKDKRWSALMRLIWPALAIATVPVTIAVGGVKVFTVLDPFLATLHRDYIQEFLPLWKTLRAFPGQAILQLIVVSSLPLVAAIATLSYRRRESPIVLWFSTFIAALLTAMAWWQSRWMLNVTGAMICLLLILLACWTASFRPIIRWAVALFTAATLFFPNVAWRYFASRSDLSARRVAPKDALGALNRDIAAVLRNSQPSGEITLLTSPNSSVGIGYYGRFRTLGTLYWENSEGLKSAAAILAAKSENEAAAFIKSHGVTHIALLSEENFIEQYHRLLHPGAPPEEATMCFGLRLLRDKIVPQWLQMIPYKIPPDLTSLGVSVMLFKVNFEQSLAEAIYNVALTQISQDAIEEADRTLDILLKQAPHLYQPWLRKGELLLSRHDWIAAAEHMIKGIGLAPEAERPALYAGAAQVFYNNNQHALVVRMYRTALAEKFSADFASYLAWVLATSIDESVRDGKEAYELAQKALKTDPNSPSYLNALAAAVAENGQFAKAIEIADRAVANARLRGEGNALKVFEQRLESLRSGQPLRN